MKEVCVNVTETSYGFVTLEVDDNATDNEIRDIAIAAAQNGDVVWHDSDYTAEDIQE